MLFLPPVSPFMVSTLFLLFFSFSNQFFVVSVAGAMAIIREQELLKQPRIGIVIVKVYICLVCILEDSEYDLDIIIW